MATVLVIEDSQAVRQQVCSALRDEGLDVVEASDAERAIALVAQQRFALVICDCHLPGRDGFAVLTELRSGQSQVPFLMLTGDAQVTLIERAKREGAQGWIVKPFKRALLLSAVRRLIKRCDEPAGS